MQTRTCGVGGYHGVNQLGIIIVKIVIKPPLRAVEGIGGAVEAWNNTVAHLKIIKTKKYEYIRNLDKFE